MKVDQCVFGYNDGHKLLATSLALGSEISALTELSDMAPGIIFGESGGYWTGVPAPSIGRYVLMRTWPAPEMSRPGCVWTHALLIDPNVLELLDDLAALKKCMRRPSIPADISEYREPLKIEPSGGSGVVDGTIVKKLLIALYQKDRAVVDIDFAGEIDDPLFAVWSQQWPRLRRNLRFQTAATRSHHSSPGVRFDLSTQIGGIRSSDLSSFVSPPWMSAAMLDVQQGGGLRDFLWRYGSDVKRQRKSFRPLAELYVMDRNISMSDGSVATQMVLNSFPTQQDGLLLKQDLVDGAIIPRAQAATMRAFFHDMTGSGLPPPTPAGIQRLTDLWGGRSEELLAIADEIADAAEPIAQLVFGACTYRLEASKFWSDTSDLPRLRERMLRENPELLLEKGSLQLDEDKLVELLALVPERALKLSSFISLLISRDNKKLADCVFDAFPSVAAEELLKAENTKELTVGQAWRSSIFSRPRLLLTSEYLGSISRTSLLYDYLVAFDGFTPEVLAAGVGPWWKALEGASNDLWGEPEDTLETFILILALRTGKNEGERAVEGLFDAIHGKVLRDSLHGRAGTLLLDCLPQLGWLSNWDIGLRLRLMVTSAYIRNDWSPQSFARLTHDHKVLSMLADAAKDVKGGKKLYKAISG
ncbi:hypothetical protein [Pseudomonas sp. FP2338]|uniref:GAP1-N1 domain-containing protein n=1 Tax=Pseudomonas sp. FP2338 TaxID=2954093 RepID=UPI0027332D63|nr:hypothetical protein [Pseudomonas sp. FP2338]WLH84325.1 hypothetical protein PSH96_26605 [Pseudomonas sp. FP2338]